MTELEDMERIVEQQSLNVHERRELNELRRRVYEQELLTPPTEPEPIQAVRMAAPLQLTSGGIQYQVDIYLKQ